jgi:hypothetical protein
LRPPAPLHFPVSEEVPETTRHMKQRHQLFETLEREFGEHAQVSSDQFLYWDPTNPKRCMAPDVALRMGLPSRLIETWKTWELGAPHLGIEITSDSDAPRLRFEEKLERYRQAGVLEVVRFDAKDQTAPIRLFDWFDGDMVERDNTDPESVRCDVLGLYWCVRQDHELGPTLRLSRDPGGRDLVLTPLEIAEASLAEARACIAELEAKLGR